MLHSPAEIAQARRRRLIIIAAIAVLVEGGLAVTAYLGPALESLIQPVYWMVLIVAAGSVIHAFRRNPNNDRRHGDRRGR